MRIEPEVGTSSAPKSWRRVLFPDPLGPMIVTSSRSSTERETPRSAVWDVAPLAYVFVRSRASSTTDDDIASFFSDGPLPQTDEIQVHVDEKMNERPQEARDRERRERRPHEHGVDEHESDRGVRLIEEHERDTPAIGQETGRDAE